MAEEPEWGELREPPSKETVKKRPSYLEMVKSAIKALKVRSLFNHEVLIMYYVQCSFLSLKERRGSSWQAIQKYITSNFDVTKNKSRVNTYIRAAISEGKKMGVLKQVGAKFKVDLLAELKIKVAGNDESDVEWLTRIENAEL